MYITSCTVLYYTILYYTILYTVYIYRYTAYSYISYIQYIYVYMYSYQLAMIYPPQSSFGTPGSPNCYLDKYAHECQKIIKTTDYDRIFREVSISVAKITIS